ncbi:MAG: hypothetical protein ACF788_03135 [Novipirellula sp. JB048]
MSEGSATTACSCCSHDEVAPTTDASDPCSEGGCGCLNCICEGAVIELPVEMPDSAIAEGTSGQPQFAMLPFAVLAQPIRWEGARRFPPQQPPGLSLCGRDLCVTHQSWLI